MKIAWFTDTYAPQINGVAVYISEAARMLSKEHEVVLFAPGEGRFRAEEVSKNLRICWIPSSPFPFYEGYRVASMNYKRISDLLKREMPDVVHAHAPINLGIQGMIAAKRRRIPLVATYHTHLPDYVPHLLNGRLPGPLMRIGRSTAKRFVRHTLGMADAVAAPTQELAGELRSYGLTNVTCIRNGVDFRKLVRDDEKAAAFRKAHGIAQDKHVVLYLGRVSFEKRLDTLLEAFRLVEGGDNVLLVVGGGPYLKDFKGFARAKGLRNVVFAGFVKDTAPAYACADIFASASDSETFGLTFIEAMHMGLPVIGVSRLGAKDIIGHGRDGLLVKPGDHRAIARAMERLLGNEGLRKRMGAQGRKKSEGYSIEASVRETLRIYSRVCRGR